MFNHSNSDDDPAYKKLKEEKEEKEEKKGVKRHQHLLYLLEPYLKD